MSRDREFDYVADDSPETRARRLEEACSQLEHAGVSPADKALARKVIAACEDHPVVRPPVPGPPRRT